MTMKFDFKTPALQQARDMFVKKTQPIVSSVKNKIDEFKREPESFTNSFVNQNWSEKPGQEMLSPVPQNQTMGTKEFAQKQSNSFWDKTDLKDALSAEKKYAPVKIKQEAQKNGWVPIRSTEVKANTITPKENLTPLKAKEQSVPKPKSVEPFVQSRKKILPKQTLYTGILQEYIPPEGNEIIRKIRETFPEDPDTAVAVFTHESGLGKMPQNLQGSNAFGVAQIMLTSHRDKIPGQTDEDKVRQLLNPHVNLAIARQIYEESGWRPWQSYTSQQYKRYMPQEQIAGF